MPGRKRLFTILGSILWLNALLFLTYLFLTPAPIWFVAGMIVWIGILFFGGLQLFARSATGFPNWLISVFSFVTIYAIGEICCYILLAGGMVSPARFQANPDTTLTILPYFENPVARYDSIRGYRWIAGGRVVKIAGDVLVYDNTFDVNNKGFHSERDYHFEKSDSSTRRYIIFGDSFTDAYFSNDPWVDSLHRVLSKQHYEFYSFGLNGGGIKGWHHVFFNEIVPYYDLDGIVLAIFGNDLARDHFILDQSQETSYYDYFYEIPPDRKAFLEWTATTDMHENTFRTTKELDSMVKHCKMINTKQAGLLTPRPYFLNFIKQLASSAVLQARHRKTQEHLNKEYLLPDEKYQNNLSYSDLTDKYGSDKIQALEEIIGYCKILEIDIRICAIPDVIGTELNRDEQKTKIQSELEFICNYYKLPYFDGYSVTASMDNTTPLFFPFDGHWTDKASHTFAHEYAKTFP